ncbi:hypothetical protein [Pseudomonas viridiflava]|uniref:hypothetical protein n=1 Tax=Pseudomonas viridiflava TaxID=33069 RepID=UPI0013C2D251|nr:hypothetical protein [Pseudomonas viridiflava]
MKIVILASLLLVSINAYSAGAGSGEKTFAAVFNHKQPIVLALSETYTGPCDGQVKDAQGQVISCPGERPVCYNDGSCSCKSDVQCD